MNDKKSCYIRFVFFFFYEHLIITFSSQTEPFQLRNYFTVGDFNTHPFPTIIPKLSQLTHCIRHVLRITMHNR